MVPNRHNQRWTDKKGVDTKTISTLFLFLDTFLGTGISPQQNRPIGNKQFEQIVLRMKQSSTSSDRKSRGIEQIKKYVGSRENKFKYLLT